jgi:sulfur-oxidizing protein SoxZ
MRLLWSKSPLVAVADKEEDMTKVKPRVKVPKTAEAGEVIEIKTLISHPMHSGRAVDGDGNLIPRKIIKSFRASFNGTEVMSVNLKPSVSANPFFTFPFKVTEPGTFDFLWVEDDGTEYKKSAKISIG